MPVKRIAVLTSGGDAPGMNAAVRSVVRTALARDLEVLGIYRGYAGLMSGEISPLNHRSVSNIINRGGTILKTSRCPELLTDEGQRRAVENIKKNNIDALVIIGGNGTQSGARVLFEKWKIPVVGVASSIDNDLNGTDFTVGYDTAVNTALSAIDKIRDTSTSMERIFVIEVMGRDCGLIALQVGLAAGAEQVIIPERRFDLQQMCNEISEGYIHGKASWIIIVAEGVMKAEVLAKKITEITNLETRIVVLGHIQRGGSPTAKDRVLATRLGAAAVDLVVKEDFGKVVGMVGENINVVPLDEAITKKSIKAEHFFNLIKILT